MTDHGGAASPRTEAGRALIEEWYPGNGDGLDSIELQDFRAAILAIEDEAAGLPSEWVWERRPGDDAECERLGCEDRTHRVQHVRRRAAQEAPAPEPLDYVPCNEPGHPKRRHLCQQMKRLAAQEAPAPEGLRAWLTTAAHDAREAEAQSKGIAAKNYHGGCASMAEATLRWLATPPTPAEPPRHIHRWRDDPPGWDTGAEARPPEGLDAAWAAAEAALPEGWVIECGDNPPNPERTYWAQAIGREIEGRHPTTGFVHGTTLAAALDALAARLSAGGATKP